MLAVSSGVRSRSSPEARLRVELPLCHGPESFACWSRFHRRRTRVDANSLFRVALSMRYMYLRDWRGGLLLRCRRRWSGSPASRAAHIRLCGQPTHRAKDDAHSRARRYCLVGFGTRAAGCRPRPRGDQSRPRRSRRRPRGARFVRADRDRLDAFGERRGRVGRRRRRDPAARPSQACRRPPRTRAPLIGYTSRRRSAYADTATPGVDESGELLPALDDEVLRDPEDYGRAKVACERYVLDTIGAEHSLIARPGLIGGPGDLFGRAGYWPLRFAQPAVPGAEFSFRRFADSGFRCSTSGTSRRWLIASAGAERATSGIFNVGGPDPAPRRAPSRWRAGSRVQRRAGGGISGMAARPRRGAVDGSALAAPLARDPAWAGLNSHDTTARRASADSRVRSSRPSPTCSSGSLRRAPIVPAEPG